MARMPGLEPHEAGWFMRFVYRIVRRKIAKLTGQAKLIEPIKVTAHHWRLLRAMAAMEAGQEAAHRVESHLKSLASIKAATMIGCPF